MLHIFGEIHRKRKGYTMKKYTRILALCLACAMMFALTACTGDKQPVDGDNTEVVDNSGEGKVFTEPTEIDMTISSHVSWPFNRDWIIWDYIEEATGATLNLTALPSSDLTTKLPLMMTSPENLPDIIHTWAKDQVDKYALSGAYLAIDDNLDRLPNFVKYWEGIDEAEKAELFAQRTSGDGKIYSTPTNGHQTVDNMRSWLYRKDIFEKHGLKVPETTDELYDVAVKLKELYPDSYPICFRSGLAKLLEWGPSWAPDYSYNAYYDFQEGKWKIGAQQDVTRDMLEYFIKLKDAGVLAPDYTSMTTKSWEELMSTDRGFITLDYVVRLDFFNVPNRAVNPDYTLAYLAPPKPTMVETGAQKMMKANLQFYGFCICNTGREKDIDNAFKFVDWFYKDDVIDLVSWGKEGETYTVDENGKKKYILTGDEQTQLKYGFLTYGTYGVKTTEANEAIYTDEQVAACHELLNYLEPNSNPTMWMPFSEDLEGEIMNLKTDVESYIEERMEKFLLGQTPLNDATWDEFQKGLDEMGADRLLELYTEAYDAVMKK